jgi:hypothetical protein
MVCFHFNFFESRWTRNGLLQRLSKKLNRKIHQVIIQAIMKKAGKTPQVVTRTGATCCANCGEDLKRNTMVSCLRKGIEAHATQFREEVFFCSQNCLNYEVKKTNLKAIDVLAESLRCRIDLIKKVGDKSECMVSSMKICNITLIMIRNLKKNDKVAYMKFKGLLQENFVDAIASASSSEATLGVSTASLDIFYLLTEFESYFL